MEWVSTLTDTVSDHLGWVFWVVALLKGGSTVLHVVTLLWSIHVGNT